MDRETMTNEENYAFDLTGYLHIPGVLTRPEVTRLNDAIDRDRIDSRACSAGKAICANHSAIC